MIKVEVVKEEDVTVEGKVIKYLEGFIEKEEKNDAFIDKIKSWIIPEPKKEKKTIIGQINTIYRQKRAKVAEKFYLGSEFLTIVELSLVKVAAKHMLVNICF